MLSMDEAAEIREKFELSNSIIAETYAIDRKKSFFNNLTLQSEVEGEPYSGLTVERTVELLFRLERKMGETKAIRGRVRNFLGRFLRMRMPTLYMVMRTLYHFVKKF